MKVLLGLLLLALTAFECSAKPTKLTGEQCDGTLCPDGCCPEYNWHCCPEFLCAATADDCIRTADATRKSLIKMAALKDCEGTVCPEGCCPEVDWFCCPDWYCARIPEDCPIVTARKSLIKMAAQKKLIAMLDVFQV